MPQFSLTQLLMTVALVAILLTLARSEGCGTRESMIGSLEFSSDGKRLLVARYDAHNAGVPLKHYLDEVCRTISVIDVEAGVPTTRIEQVVKSTSGPAFQLFWKGRRSAAFAQENRGVVVADLDGGELWLYDLGTRNRRTPFAGCNQHSLNLAVSRNEELLATGDGTEVVLWDVNAGKQVRRLATGDTSDPFLGSPLIACSADGELVATGSIVAGIQLWKVSDGTKSWPSSIVPIQVKSAFHEQPFIFSPTSHTLAVAMPDRVCLYDVDRKLSRDVPCSGMSSIEFSSTAANWLR